MNGNNDYKFEDYRDVLIAIVATSRINFASVGHFQSTVDNAASLALTTAQRLMKDRQEYQAAQGTSKGVKA